MFIAGRVHGVYRNKIAHDLMDFSLSICCVYRDCIGVDMSLVKIVI